MWYSRRGVFLSFSPIYIFELVVYSRKCPVLKSVPSHTNDEETIHLFDCKENNIVSSTKIEQTGKSGNYVLYNSADIYLQYSFVSKREKKYSLDANSTLLKSNTHVIYFERRL